MSLSAIFKSVYFLCRLPLNRALFQLTTSQTASSSVGNTISRGFPPSTRLLHSVLNFRQRSHTCPERGRLQVHGLPVRLMSCRYKGPELLQNSFPVRLALKVHRPLASLFFTCLHFLCSCSEYRDVVPSTTLTSVWAYCMLQQCQWAPSYQALETIFNFS